MIGRTLMAILALAPVVVSFPASAANDKAQIEALESRLATAVSDKSIDGIMKAYLPGQNLFVFDLIPPRQYVGSDAYRKDWQGFLDTFQGPIQFSISDLAISTDGKIAYSHSIQHVAGTDTKGKPIDITVRLTDVYRKIRGRWFIVQEHASVPVDLGTGKPDLASTP